MKNVLVVDDEKEVVDFLCHFIQRFKVTAHKAVTGAAALKVFDDIDPDLVFLDIRMPDIDGLEVLRRVKEKSPLKKVIMITGRDDAEAQDEAKKLGALDYIMKPLDLDELHRKIKEHL